MKASDWIGKYRNGSMSSPTSWGRRSTYFVYPDSSTPNTYFMGFDKLSRKALRANQAPPPNSKYARFQF